MHVRDRKSRVWQVFPFAVRMPGGGAEAPPAHHGGAAA
jgi:hypothetical protein